MADEVELSIQGEVALVQLRRPQKGNALCGTMFDLLRKLALKLSDAPPRFVVITGEGNDFCVGLERNASDGLYTTFDQLVRLRDAHRAQELVTRIRGSIDAFTRLPCPVIAAIEGRCHGAGLELALIADLRIATAGATFQFVEGRLGLVSGLGGLVRTTQILGHARATDLVLTGGSLNAEEAQRLGLISRIVPNGGALSGALELVQELRRTPSTARTQALLALRAIHARNATELYDQESQAAARTWIATDWQVALKAIEQGKEPTW